MNNELQKELEIWLKDVLVDWNKHWANRPDHRYGKDVAAFVGERLLTDFNLRGRETRVSERKATTNSSNTQDKPC